MTAEEEIAQNTTKWHIHGTKLYIWIFQWCFKVPRDVRLNSTHYNIIFSNKIELQWMTCDHSAGYRFKELKTKLQ